MEMFIREELFFKIAYPNIPNPNPKYQNPINCVKDRHNLFAKKLHF